MAFAQQELAGPNYFGAALCLLTFSRCAGRWRQAALLRFIGGLVITGVTRGAGRVQVCTLSSPYVGSCHPLTGGDSSGPERSRAVPSGPEPVSGRPEPSRAVPSDLWPPPLSLTALRVRHSPYFRPRNETKPLNTGMWSAVSKRGPSSSLAGPGRPLSRAVSQAPGRPPSTKVPQRQAIAPKSPIMSSGPKVHKKVQNPPRDT